MGTQFLDIVIGRCTTQQTQLNSTMFRFVALFALVAVAAAEPESDSDAFMQYHHGGEAHMKTVTGDTASVAAAKEDHFQMKAAECQEGICRTLCLRKLPIPNLRIPIPPSTTIRLQDPSSHPSCLQQRCRTTSCLQEPSCPSTIRLQDPICLHSSHLCSQCCPSIHLFHANLHPRCLLCLSIPPSWKA